MPNRNISPTANKSAIVEAFATLLELLGNVLLERLFLYNVFFYLILLNQKLLKEEAKNKLLEEKIKHLEEEIKLLKTQKHGKSIKDYFKKK